MELKINLHKNNKSHHYSFKSEKGKKSILNPRSLIARPHLSSPSSCIDYGDEGSDRRFLAVGEISSVKAAVAVVSAGGRGWRVGSGCQWAGGFKMEFFLFQIWMNSDVICYFCVDLFIAPKNYENFCVTSLWCILFRKNMKFCFLVFFYVIKIAQLINKWVFMIFLGLFVYPKIMKIVLPLSYHVMNIYKNFEVNWNKLIYFIILN